MYMQRLKFAHWLAEFNMGTLETEIVDSKPIESLYAKSKNAVDLVRKYDMAEGEHNWIKTRLGWQGPRNDFGYLLNIGLIAPLSGTVYGLFNSKENQRILDKDVRKKGIAFSANRPLTNDDYGNQDVLKNLSFNVMKQRFPDIDPNKIHDSAVIHVNVPSIINNLHRSGLQGKELEKAIIKEIAKTIVHESTHQLERTWLGHTEEGGPQESEKRFEDWLNRNEALLNQAAQ
jgi:hypothetical protein